MPLLDDMARQRAFIYRWFSQLLFQELSEEALMDLRNKENRVLLEALKTIPELWVPVRQFQLRLRSAWCRKERQLELAADFASLFLLPPPAGVSPYAGHYSHTSAPEERATMHQWLVHYQLAPQNNEACDHVAVQLALMATLAEIDEDPVQQYQFLKEHLLSWLPKLSQCCQPRDNFGFYAAAAEMISGFVRQDAQWLSECMQS
ncbi:molecular chaperone TorD [Buttiauxella brennerae]|uniref:molecular chaperone TorD n=1 Tax=Buttiauxella brennerae TaxID=82988 RepID=UPI00286F3368|nr:molecular chaperone TorD [Buttiauxella brennerae]